MTKTIAVITDIHSNASALTSAIAHIKQRQPDWVVCLGDLLTYGAEPIAVINQLQQLDTEFTTFFIKGNHDQFYFDLQNGDDTAIKALPAWMQESLHWHVSQLQLPLITAFNWQDSLTLGPIYFAHANPFAYGDWTYLNHPDRILDASRALTTRLACFGHTHRQMITLVTDNDDLKNYEGPTTLNLQDTDWQTAIINPGSVGQPRGTGSSFVYFSINENTVAVEHIELNYAVEQHVASIMATNLSSATKQQATKYYK